MPYHHLTSYRHGAGSHQPNALFWRHAGSHREQAGSFPPNDLARNRVQRADRLRRLLCSPGAWLTDNGPSFVARRFAAFVREQFRHVRIRYRTPTQLGLMQRFHQTLKNEEVYWRHRLRCTHTSRTVGWSQRS